MHAYSIGSVANSVCIGAELEAVIVGIDINGSVKRGIGRDI